MDSSGEIYENDATFEILSNSTEEIDFTEQNEGSGLMYKMLKINADLDDFEGSSSGEEIEFSGTEPGEEHAENCTLLDDNNTMIPCDQTSRPIVHEAIIVDSEKKEEKDDDQLNSKIVRRAFRKTIFFYRL